MSVIAQLCAAAAVAVCPSVTEVQPFPQRAMINLWTGQIFVERGLVKNADELAFVLGHELGHLALRLEHHTELDADEYGIRLMKQAGFSCRGIDVLKRIDAMRWKIAKEKC